VEEERAALQIKMAVVVQTLFLTPSLLLVAEEEGVGLLLLIMD